MSAPGLDARRLRAHVRAAAAPFYRGHVDIVSGVLVEALGVPAAMGELCRIRAGGPTRDDGDERDRWTDPSPLV